MKKKSLLKSYGLYLIRWYVKAISINGETTILFVVGEGDKGEKDR